MAEEFVIGLRSPADQAQYERLRDVLVRTLDLTWKGMPGEPDGSEIADDCAEALWHVGFRLKPGEGVGTGAGEGAPRQDTGSARVTRSVDCPEAPARAHLLAALERTRVEAAKLCTCPPAYRADTGWHQHDCPTRRIELAIEPWPRPRNT